MMLWMLGRVSFAETRFPYDWNRLCQRNFEPGALNRRQRGRGAALGYRSTLCLMSLTAWTRPRRLARDQNCERTPWQEARALRWQVVAGRHSHLPWARCRCPQHGEGFAGAGPSAPSI